jgi:hypothetical protein
LKRRSVSCGEPKLYRVLSTARTVHKTTRAITINSAIGNLHKRHAVTDDFTLFQIVAINRVPLTNLVFPDLSTPIENRT